MNESRPDPGESRPESVEVVQGLRTKEPEAPFGADEPNPNVVSDEIAGDKDPSEAQTPGAAGYAGRDPKTDMPRMPSAGESQDDPKSREPESDGTERRPAK